MKITWGEFKEINNAVMAPSYYVTRTNGYFIFNPTTKVETNISTGTSDCTDFENNYKSIFNKSLYDSSGRSFKRQAICESGKALSCLTFEFETSKLNSFSSIKKDNSTPVPGFTHKIFKAGDIEISDPADEQYCIKNTISYKPSFAYELIGGSVHHIVRPTTPVKCFFTAVPSIPSYTKEMCNGGLNLEFMESHEQFVLDGRAPKTFPYIEGVATNELLMTVFNNAGINHRIMVRLEMYI